MMTPYNDYRKVAPHYSCSVTLYCGDTAGRSQLGHLHPIDAMPRVCYAHPVLFSLEMRRQFLRRSTPPGEKFTRRPEDLYYNGIHLA
jgi:hypothetical protein